MLNGEAQAIRCKSSEMIIGVKELATAQNVRLNITVETSGECPHGLVNE